LRTPWRAPVVSKTPSHARTNTFPSARQNSVQWPHSPRGPCGSPRDSAELSYFRDPDLDCDRDSDDAITLVPSLRRRNSSGSGSRNHTRGGTIELSHAPGVKRTPPSSPFNSPAPLPLPLSAPISAHPQAQPMVRFNSFPPHSSPKRQLQTQTQTQTPDSYEEGLYRPAASLKGQLRPHKTRLLTHSLYHKQPRLHVSRISVFPWIARLATPIQNDVVTTPTSEKSSWTNINRGVRYLGWGALSSNPLTQRSDISRPSLYADTA
jgi:hypothetical protein